MTVAADGMSLASRSRRWPAEGRTRVPYWVYCDPGIYEQEQRRIVAGYEDRILLDAPDQGEAFVEKLVILDSRVIDTLLAIPL